MTTKIDAKTARIIQRALDAVANPTSNRTTRLPRWMPDGSEAKTAEDFAVLLGTTPEIAALAMEEAKVRHVRDPEYWDAPYGTPIVPGMKPGIPQIDVPRRAAKPRRKPTGKADLRYRPVTHDATGKEIDYEGHEQNDEAVDPALKQVAVRRMFDRITKDNPHWREDFASFKAVQQKRYDDEAEHVKSMIEKYPDDEWWEGRYSDFFDSDGEPVEGGFDDWMRRQINRNGYWTESLSGDEANLVNTLDDLVGSWATSSMDHSSTSIAMQLGALELMELDEKTSMAHVSDHALSNARETYNTHRAGIQAMLRATYAETQEYFREQGMTHVHLTRGQGVERDQFDPAEIVAQYRKALDTPEMKKKMEDELANTASHFDWTNVAFDESGDYGLQQRAALREAAEVFGARNKFAVRVDMDVQLQPLSSWATIEESAHEFVSSDGALFNAEYPVERIFTIPGRGLGCYVENEMVVAGSQEPDQMSVSFRTGEAVMRDVMDDTLSADDVKVPQQVLDRVNPNDTLTMPVGTRLVGYYPRHANPRLMFKVGPDTWIDKWGHKNDAHQETWFRVYNDGGMVKLPPEEDIDGGMYDTHRLATEETLKHAGYSTRLWYGGRVWAFNDQGNTFTGGKPYWYELEGPEGTGIGDSESAQRIPMDTMRTLVERRKVSMARAIHDYLMETAQLVEEEEL